MTTKGRGTNDLNSQTLAFKMGKPQFLVYLLRHGLKKQRINHEPDGYVTCKELERFGFGVDEIIDIADHDDKGRFEVQLSPILKVRAVQGHSAKLVQNPEKLPLHPADIIATHSTNNVLAIRSSGYLRPMAREHIHLKPGPVGSYPRRQQLTVNIQTAQEHGIRFHRSSNGYILTSDPIPWNLLTLRE